ncbi:DUF1471 domain-containing protein [Enterobacteriaceae bacterium H11S18]|uniref:YdgH/BhsA/McbA-like domain containing protein n=1 Tax=Dryocola clanedunensis TaxID=2925396 RepID=UPI0022F050BE|nr:YdgH/BhsA/McbA-like domain containing protein [Dryocola clanedunensis]MCT4708883.1 DUF1471 domain-containing protein [Dryocola clanedunensis]
MKSIIKLSIAALVLTTSTLAFAGDAKEVNRTEAVSLQKIGNVSAGGFTNLDELNASLAMKASEAGASHYRIVGASGMNRLSGTAVLYR